MEEINRKLYAKLEASDDQQLAEPAKGKDRDLRIENPRRIPRLEK